MEEMGEMRDQGEFPEMVRGTARVKEGMPDKVVMVVLVQEVVMVRMPPTDS